MMEEIKQALTKIAETQTQMKESQIKMEKDMEYVKIDLHDHKEGVIQNRSNIWKIILALSILASLGLIEKLPSIMKLMKLI